MQNYRRICLLTLGLLGCGTLWADDFHYKNTVIGVVIVLLVKMVR